DSSLASQEHEPELTAPNGFEGRARTFQIGLAAHQGCDRLTLGAGDMRGAAESAHALHQGPEVRIRAVVGSVLRVRPFGRSQAPRTCTGLDDAGDDRGIVREVDVQ